LNPRFKTLVLIILLPLIIFSSSAFADDLADEAYPARVTDISDRKYEHAVIELLDNAKESIVMSMYIIRSDGGGPVSLLLRDLEEALDRGVSVEIYLNIRPDRNMPSGDVLMEPLRSIVAKGAKIYKVAPSARLHDKLIIVDGRFVVDGSVNWSVSAIKSNHESAVLIDSPGLAKVKLLRLKRFPMEGDNVKEKETPRRPAVLEPLAEGTVVAVSRELMDNRCYFPRMLKRRAYNTMDLYLLLLAESARSGDTEFFVSPENLAVSIGLSPKWTDTALRRQVIKILRSLENEYVLINVDFRYGKDVWVELRQPPGATFNVDGSFFSPDNLASKDQPAKFVSLVKDFLASEGSSLEDCSVRDLARRFGVSECSIRTGKKQI
jgi:hypothetical protein